MPDDRHRLPSSPPAVSHAFPSFSGAPKVPLKTATPDQGWKVLYALLAGLDSWRVALLPLLPGNLSRRGPVLAGRKKGRPGVRPTGSRYFAEKSHYSRRCARCHACGFGAFALAGCSGPRSLVQAAITFGVKFARRSIGGVARRRIQVVEWAGPVERGGVKRPTGQNRKWGVG